MLCNNVERLVDFGSFASPDPPRIARLVALAHKPDALVRSGEVSDYGELAGLGRDIAVTGNTGAAVNVLALIDLQVELSQEWSIKGHRNTLCLITRRRRARCNRHSRIIAEFARLDPPHRDFVQPPGKASDESPKNQQERSVRPHVQV
jgi:hypothetical protein